MTKFCAIALGIFLAFAGSVTVANAWTVARSTGEVWVGGGDTQKVSLGPTADVPNGATVTTGKSGRALLVRGKETMTIGPNTVVTIPGDNLFGFTTIVQRAGEIEFDVEKRNVSHFEVQTPYLAAVVKGTRFVVRVSRSGAKVSVNRGRVGVTDLATGQRSDVLPGQTAQVSGHTGGLVLSGTPDTALNDDTSGKSKDKGENSESSGKGSNVSSNSGSGNGNGNGNSGGNGNGNGGGNGNGNGDGNGNGGGGED